MKIHGSAAHSSPPLFARAVKAGTLGVVFAVLSLLMQGCGSGGPALTIKNQTSAEIELFSDAFDGGVKVMPHTEREMPTRPFRGGTQFWYFEKPGGQKVEMTSGSVVHSKKGPLWFDRSELTIDSNGVMSLHVLETSAR